MRKIYIARMFVVAILLFTVETRSLNAQTSVTLGVTTRTGTTGLPFVIAEEKGFFKSEGLNGIVVVMQNQVVVNGVVTRNVDYGGTFSNFIGAAISGLPVRIVMAVMEGSDHYLVASAKHKACGRPEGQELRHQQLRRHASQRSDHDPAKVRHEPGERCDFPADRRQLEPLCGVGQRLHRCRHAGAAVQ